jgi:hypothetical protein
MATGSPISPHARPDPAPSVPPRLGLFASQLELAAPGYVRRKNAATSHQRVPEKRPLASEVLVVPA